MLSGSQVFRDVVRLLIFNNVTVSVHQQRLFNCNHRRFSPSFRLSLRNIPQTKMSQNLADHCRGFDTCQHPHRAVTLGTGERITLVYLAESASPSWHDTSCDTPNLLPARQFLVSRRLSTHASCACLWLRCCSNRNSAPSAHHVGECG